MLHLKYGHKQQKMKLGIIIISNSVGLLMDYSQHLNLMLLNILKMTELNNKKRKDSKEFLIQQLFQFITKN